MAIDFFSYTGDIRSYAPQVKSDTDIDDFKPYIRPQKQKVIRLIGKETYNQILDDYTNQWVDPVLMAGWEYMQAALANMMAVPYFKFDAQERNNTDNNLFRYQENAQLEEYLENSWTELDNLLEHLEANPVQYPDYQTTDQFAERENLFLKSGFDFQKYYGSNAYKSAYFYNATVFLQKEIQEDEIKSRYADFIDATSDREKFLIGKVIAYGVMAKVCRQFDFTELPKPLRGAVLSDIDTRKAKGTDTERKIQLAYSDDFGSTMRKFIMELENARNESRNDGDFVVDENPTTSDDKFYLPC